MPSSSRGFRRGSFRGRGKNSSSRGSGYRKIFHSTRVEDPAENALDGSLDLEDGQERSLKDSSESISSADEEENIHITNSYNVLLQSLNNQALKSKPTRKKQKISHEPSHALSEQAQDTVRDSRDEEAEDVDHVNEPEDGHVNSYQDDDQDEDEEREDPGDPFELHFSNLSGDKLMQQVQEITASSIPSQKLYLEDNWKVIASRPLTAGNAEMSKTPFAPFYSLSDVSLKKKLQVQGQKLLPELKGVQSNLAQIMFNYKDLLFCERHSDNATNLRILTCLHVLNHVLKTRDRVIRNSFRLAKAGDDVEIEHRDQGFTRPKVLMLLPTRQACAKVVDKIISLYAPEQQENKKRFQDSYSQAEEKSSVEKPKDFQELFGGNDDDMFRLGLKFTRKTVKFFAQFYNSDIIFASPLGLRMSMGSEDSKKQDYDFLSSIEVVVVDHADALLMQNWEHVEHILDHLNLQPKESHGCDFSRVRNWYLDGNAKYLRQTIVLSNFNTPEINQLYNQYMLNVGGKLKITHHNYDGEIVHLGLLVKQTFFRFEALQPAADPDSRFKYFSNVIMPRVTRAITSNIKGSQGVLIFIPSYMDFVRIRNFLVNSPATQSISFGSVSEYTSVPDVARARSHFFSGRHSVLLYTSRAHHFRRYRIRGVKRVIMYGLPDNPIFYQEIVGGFLSRSISEGQVDISVANVEVLFSKWDSLKLERIVGTHRIATLLKEGGDTFDFL